MEMTTVFLSVFLWLIAAAVTLALLFGIVRAAILSALAEDRRRTEAARSDQ